MEKKIHGYINDLLTDITKSKTIFLRAKNKTTPT